MTANSSYHTLCQGGSTSFYTHSTCIGLGEQATIHIASLKLPELQLRLPSSDDALALLNLFKDQRNVQYDKSFAGLDNAEAIDESIAQWRNISPISLILRRANIVVTVNEHIVGTGCLGWIGFRKPDGMLIGDAGIMLDSDWRGKGYAYETLWMVIDYGFRTPGMEEIHLACVNANSAFDGLMNTRFGFEAAPIQDKMFGNEWIRRIMRDDWYVSRHFAKGRVKNVTVLD
jgi:RimJ/RimL family protein N-acetyltransferase